MNVIENIGRLQRLLERVQARASGPRLKSASVVGVPSASSPDAYVLGEPIVAKVVDATAGVPPSPPVEAVPHVAVALAYDNTDAEVEIASETVEVDIDEGDEELSEGSELASQDVRARFESGAQPVANPTTMPPDDLLSDDDEEEETLSSRPREGLMAPDLHPPALEHDVTHTTPGNEVEEPAPSSSRRPRAEEEAIVASEEPSSAPRHTPPPESGRQVAASVFPLANKPSIVPPIPAPALLDMPSSSSAPPPSVEGHTLVGGWREPGLGASPPVPVAEAMEPLQPLPRRSLAPGSIYPAVITSSLSADVTHPPLLQHSGSVARFEGAAEVPKPTTLGELLDFTLSL